MNRGIIFLVFTFIIGLLIRQFFGFEISALFLLAFAITGICSILRSLE